jgi:hypothetical protein
VQALYSPMGLLRYIHPSPNPVWRPRYDPVVSGGVSPGQATGLAAAIDAVAQIAAGLARTLQIFATGRGVVPFWGVQGLAGFLLPSPEAQWRLHGGA